MSLSVSNSDSLDQRVANWPPSWSLPHGETRAWWMGTGLPQLIWRESRSLLVWFATSLLLSLGIMTLYMVPQLSNPETNSAFYTLESMQWLYLHAWLGPIIFLVGALVSSFASESEDPSFQWCTSLPMRWYQAWSVKLGLTLIGALACWGICWYAASVWTQFLPWVHPSLSQQQSYDQLPMDMARFWPIVLAIYTVGVLCLLLTRHVLAGVCLATGVSLGLAYTWLGPPPAHIDSTTIVHRISVFLLDPRIVSFGCLAFSALAYRWRWYRGLYAGGGLGGFWGARRAVVAPAAGIPWGPAWSPPPAALALGWLAWRKVSWLGWWVGAAAIVLVIAGQTKLSGNTPLLFAIFPFVILTLFFLFGLISIWSVAGERAGEPQSFLAERGVSPTGYWWSRYAVMVLGSVLLLTGLYVALNELGRLTRGSFVPLLPTEGYAWTLLLFALALHAIGSLGLLAGQLLRSWEVAFMSLIVCTILLLMLAANAYETSGLPGLLWSWGVVLLVVPLSWALSWVGLARWQPRLGWVFPLVVLGIIAASLLGVSWLRVQVLPPPNPVLAQARSLPAIQANVLHGFRRRHLPAFRDAYTAAETEEVRGLVRLTQSDLREMLDWIESCEAPDFDPAIIDERSGPRFYAEAQPQNAALIPDDQLTLEEIAHIRNLFVTLGKNAIVALELGEWEVAELLLLLRVKLLTAARPIAGVCGLDVHQNTFLESLSYRASDEAMAGLHGLLNKYPHLLTGDPTQAHDQWMAAMESQFSFIYRKGFNGTAHADLPSLPNETTAGMATDRWQQQLQFGQKFHRSAALPWSWLPEARERERYQREVSTAYREFLDYCRTGKMPKNLSEHEFGKAIATHRLFEQIRLWQQEWSLANYVILGRAATQLPADPKP